MENKKIKIGFMPLYIKLYDDGGGNKLTRPHLVQFYFDLGKTFEQKGLDVVYTDDLCRIEPEFEAAIARFEEEKVDCIVTWHAAYNPSLECIGPLSKTKLPIVILDTTETYDFGPAQDQAEISYCHGIHGVMDMCNLLKRKGKQYALAVGHYATSDVIDKAIGFVNAAVAAKALAGSRVGSMGGSFDGMGDFLVSDEEMLSRFGVTVVYADKDNMAKLVSEVDDKAVAAEMEIDKQNNYEIEPVNAEVHAKTVRNCLAVRKWLEDEKLDAFTANFREIKSAGLQLMPFMEANKAMARSTGYAGEGDVLTASFVGALMKGFKNKTAFIEIFCPDWKGNSLLLSHMGEFNPDLVERKPGMKEINFVFGADNPIVNYGCYRGGKAVYANIYRDIDDFKLLISEVEMDDVKLDGTFETRVRGWMRPHMPIADFLCKISTAGVTHHSMLVYDATAEQIGYFASLLGIKYDII